MREKIEGIEEIGEREREQFCLYSNIKNER